MSLPNPLFIPECYFDLELLKTFGIQKKNIDKGSSKGDVSNRLKKLSQHSITVIGVVDQDPQSSEPSFFKEFQTIKSESDINLRKMRSVNTFILTLCPDIEHWLYKSAFEAGIQPDAKPFNLPKSPRDLHDNRTGRKNVNDDQQVISFMNEVIKSKSMRIEYLIKTISEFL